MFQTLDHTKFLLCLVYLSMGTVSGMTHIKTIFSFLSDIGKHFIDNMVCNSDDSMMQLTCILPFFFTMNRVLYKPPEEEIQRSQIWRTSGPGNESLSSLPMFRKLPIQKNVNMTGEVKFSN